MPLTSNTRISSLHRLVLGHRLQWFQKHPISSLFSYRKANVTKMVRVTLGISLEQTIMGRSPQCYIPSSWKSVLRFWRRRFLKGFYHIWACLTFTEYIYTFTEIWGVQSHIAENLEIENEYRCRIICLPLLCRESF